MTPCIHIPFQFTFHSPENLKIKYIERLESPASLWDQQIVTSSESIVLINKPKRTGDLDQIPQKHSPLHNSLNLVNVSQILEKVRLEVVRNWPLNATKDRFEDFTNKGQFKRTFYFGRAKKILGFNHSAHSLKPKISPISQQQLSGGNSNFQAS